MHAAALIRRREIILETDLLANPRLLRLILVHEIFHFVWPRLGNSLRNAFAQILATELQAHARGELGESSEVAKGLLAPSDRLRNSRAWREYVCESFCDTAACLYAGVPRDAGFTLGKRWRRHREDWLRRVFQAGGKC